MNLRDKTVLIVDDFLNMRSTLRHMLSSLGCQRITLAASGEEALAILRLHHHDVILCDYNLGNGLDGQQMLDQARTEGCIDLGTVFIMITAENSNSMVMGALESAPDAYISKPFTKDLLRTRIERALRRREPLIAIARSLKKDGLIAALTRIEIALETATDNRLELLRLQAELALRAERYDLALTAARNAQVQRPLPWALTCMGQIAQHNGDVTTAETYYRRSIALMPYYMVAHDQLAALYLQQGRQTEAFNVLQTASERSPKSLPRQRQLAQVATLIERPDVAELAWQRIINMSRHLGAVPAADYFHFIMTLLVQQDIRQAKKWLDVMEQELTTDADAIWWLLAAKLQHYMHSVPLSPDRYAAILVELETQLMRHNPAPEPAAALAAAFTAIGDTTRAAALLQENAV